MSRRFIKNSKSMKYFVSSFTPMLLVAIVSCIVFAFMAHSLIRAFVTAQATSAIEKLSSQVMERFAPNIQMVENLTEYAEKYPDQKALDVLVHSLAKGSENLDSLYYATIKSRFDGGIYVDSSDFEVEDDWEPSDYDWFRDTIRNGGHLTFLDAEEDETDGSISITISKAAVDKSNTPVGMAGVDITVDELSEIAEKITVSPRTSLYILDAKGLYMANAEPEKLLSANYFDETEYEFDPEEWLNGKQKVILDSGNFYGVNRIGETPWFVVIEGPVADFSGSFNFKFVLVIFVLLFLSGGSAIFNSFFINYIQKKEKVLGLKLFEETQNLVVATKETAATSQDQSAAVKEIVATMEDSNLLSENIAQKIKDVSQVAQKTSADVTDGVAYIEKNVNQLHDIFDANQKTIDGMKILSTRIESIWDIVTLINSVADQAKIIAFNAELEASNAGESGRNFHIVATEIRRLADGIIDGTKEIKEKINEIQQSSDSLVLASESGTAKINAGYENAKDLESKFESIKTAAEITADSASDITEIMQQQAIASEQILITLKQISAGVENFTVATDNISSSAENLRIISEDLNNQVKDEE